MALVGATMMVALFIAACGGTTAATPGCLKTNAGCYAIARYFKQGTDFTGQLNGVYTLTSVVPMICNVQCQQEKGFIANYLLLGTSNFKQWSEIGYRADGALGGAQYFYEARSDGQNVIFDNESLLEPEDMHEGVQFAINRFVPNPINKITSPHIVERLEGGFSNILIDRGWDFTPGAAEFGQLLHGTHGEAAKSTYFFDNHYTAVPATDYNNFFFSQQDFPGVFQGQGLPLLDQPPYGKWVSSVFYTECCTPFP